MRLKRFSIICPILLYLHIANCAPRPRPQQSPFPGGFPQQAPINGISQPIQSGNPSIIGSDAPILSPIQVAPDANEISLPNQQQLPVNGFQPQQGFPSQQAPAFLPPQQVPSIGSNFPVQPSPLSSIPEITPSTTHKPPTPLAPKIVPPPVDKNVDLDGDGALSLTEVQYAAFVHHGLSSSVVENLFNQVDHNHDGYLTSMEFNDIRPLVLAKAENAAQRYLTSVDSDKNGLLSLTEAQAYILKEYGISNRDVERIWRLVVPTSSDEMDAVLFSKLRRRIRGMSIRLARQIMKTADLNQDGHIDLKEAQKLAFEQEGIPGADVVEMLASVDDNNDNELNAPEFADFERIVRAKAVETSAKALKVVDTDGSGSIAMDEAKGIAFDHYGFDERTLEPFFAQADENEDGALNAVEFAGFRSVIRARAVKNAGSVLIEVDIDNDGMINNLEAEEKARREDDMEPRETFNLFNVADQDKSSSLDKVEFADFLRLVRLSAIKYATDHFREFDLNHDRRVTVDELQKIIEEKYQVAPEITRDYFERVDVDYSQDLSPGEIVDFRHEIRRYVAERNVKTEIEAQNRKDPTEVEGGLKESQERPQEPLETTENETPRESSSKEHKEKPRRHPSKTKSKSSSLEDRKVALENQESQSHQVDETPATTAARVSEEKAPHQTSKERSKQTQSEDVVLERKNRMNPKEKEEECDPEEVTTVAAAKEESTTVKPVKDHTTILKPRKRKGKKSTAETVQPILIEGTLEPTTQQISTTEEPTTVEVTTITQEQENNEVDEEVEEMEEEEEEETETMPPTTTTEKPKKKRKRLRKKTATPTPTTTTHAPEYEEGEEYEEEEQTEKTDAATKIPLRI